MNNILENQSDLKIAVLVNEFGDINIDTIMGIITTMNITMTTNIIIITRRI